jgi:HAD superfamily hydrolase (TIGR01509 family)
MPAKYQAILFDFDGVLADTEPLHHESWRDILTPFGFDLDWPMYQRHCVGVAAPVFWETLARLPGARFTAGDLHEAYPRKRALFRQKTHDGAVIHPETRDILHSLAAYRIGLVTSNLGEDVEPILVAAGVRHIFGSLVTREDGLPLKPAPDPYLAAARKLGVTRALVVEDSEAGIASGRAAGFDVLAIDHARRMPQLLRAFLANGH